MNKEELIKFLKDNLKIEINEVSYDHYGEETTYNISLSLEDEEICKTSFCITDNGGFYS